jgi:hypothetical protein
MRRNPGQAQRPTKTGERGQSPRLHLPLGSSPALNTRPLGLVPGVGSGAGAVPDPSVLAQDPAVLILEPAVFVLRYPWIIFG